MTDCPEALKASKYHDAELEDSERITFENHLQTCKACQAAVHDYASLTGIYRADDAPLFSSKVESRVFLNNLKAEFENGFGKTRERFAYPMFAAAAMLLVSTLTFSVYTRLTPASVDDLATNWVQYIVTDPVRSGSDSESASDDEENLTEWMTIALSEEYANE